jgi:hypothetical protein
MKRNLLRIAALIGGFALFGCAVQPARKLHQEVLPVPDARILSPRWQRPAPNTAPLVFERDDGAERPPCGNQLSVDGTEVAILKPAERIELHLPFGDHVLMTQAVAVPTTKPAARLCMGGLADAVVSVRPGVRQAYRLSYNAGGDLHIWPVASHPIP